MQKVALFVAVVSLALSGWLAGSQAGLFGGGAPARPEADAIAALEARVAALETPGSGAPVRPRLALPGGPGAPPPASSDDAPPALASAPARPVAPPAPAAETVTALEKRLAALEEKAKARDAAPAPFGRVRGPGGGRMYMNVDDAKDDLALTDPQKADWDRVVADAQRELEELRKAPDDDGKTYEGMMKEMMEGAGTDGGGMKLDLGKMVGWRNKRIAGRNETFGQADQRIKTEAKRRLRDGLSSEQQAKFDKASVDPMLGGGFGPAVMSFAVSSDPTPAAPAAPGGR